MKNINSLSSILLLLCFTQSFTKAAVMAVGESLTSSIIANSGPQNEPNDTSNTVGSTIVEASDTAWVINPHTNDYGFSAGFGSDAGGVSALRGKGKPSGPISVVGTMVSSSLTFELAEGQTANFDFELNYLISSQQGAGAPSITWSLVKVGGTSIFSGSDSTNGSSSTGILSGILSEAGEYELVITASLNDSSMPPNSSASASFQNINFNLFGNTVPEPSGNILLASGFMLLLIKRVR